MTGIYWSDLAPTVAAARQAKDRPDLIERVTAEYNLNSPFFTSYTRS